MNILNTYKLYKNAFLFGGLAILLFCLLQQCNSNQNLKREIVQVQRVSDRNLNNYKAMQDTIIVEKNKNEELVSSIRSFEYDVNTLTENNKKLVSKYTNQLSINSELENVNSLLSTTLNVKDSIIDANGIVTVDTDSINNIDTITVDVNDKWEFDKYNWRRFNGSISLLKDSTNYSLFSSRFDIIQGIGLSAAIINEEGFDRLKITTPYKGVTFTNIENINLVNDRLNNKYEKKAGWSIGVGFQYGINLNNNQVISTGPAIGIGVYWSPKFLRF